MLPTPKPTTPRGQGSLKRAREGQEGFGSSREGGKLEEIEKNGVENRGYL